MHVGHINLAEAFNGVGEHFVRLIEELKLHGVEQHVVVRNTELAKRLEIIDGVTVGPCVRSAVTAYCLMPNVDVVHLHDRSSWNAGLLLVLTRSIPFVMTADKAIALSNSPLVSAVRNRAASLVDPEIAEVSTHIQIYRQAADQLSMPTLML
ncbi:MAG: hypothetical protein AAFN50_02890 [Pseudomonadota bacterium]